MEACFESLFKSVYCCFHYLFSFIVYFIITCVTIYMPIIYLICSVLHVVSCGLFCNLLFMLRRPSENKLPDFRPIALLNVEGKLFFRLVSKCLEAHLIHNNKFIDNSIQKGCMENIPGCWEHLLMVWHALKEARAKKSNLVVIWLDIENAYGYILHKLIVFALHRYGVFPLWIRLIETYYEGIFSKSFSESATSAWHRHQQEIFAGWYEHHT